VLDFGAVSADDRDDTVAFHRALGESTGKVILIPAGRSLLADMHRDDDPRNRVWFDATDNTYSPAASWNKRKRPRRQGASM